MRYGRWWAAQTNNGLSLGVHVDLRRRRVGGTGQRYGPYVDFHIARWVVSFGVNPIYAGSLDLMRSFARGGIEA